jgi:hypothetical protein
MYDAQRIVRLDQHICIYGRWQLNGIPCAHACAAIYIYKHMPEAYLNGYYKMDKYMEGYVARVFGVEGPNTWPANDPCNAILPLVVRKAPSRPKIARQRAVDEPTNPYKLTLSG